MVRVRGYNLVALPPARMIPFIYTDLHEDGTLGGASLHVNLGGNHGRKVPPNCRLPARHRDTDTIKPQIRKRAESWARRNGLEISHRHRLDASGDAQRARDLHC